MKKNRLSQINEATNSPMGGAYTSPLDVKLRKWKLDTLKPFNVDIHDSLDPDQYIDELNSDNVIKEDLAVWFGTKKKPKGSKQPKGPWVNICRKDENGKHPPCGRDKASNKGYPKCRAVGVAAKMSDSEKKSACQQKRQAEKNNPKSGTGNKPKMVKYEPKKRKNLKEIINLVLKEYVNTYSSS